MEKINWKEYPNVVGAFWTIIGYAIGVPIGIWIVFSVMRWLKW